MARLSPLPLLLLLLLCGAATVHSASHSGATCTDNTMNGDETEVDRGGSCAADPAASSVAYVCDTSEIGKATSTKNVSKLDWDPCTYATKGESIATAAAADVKALGTTVQQVIVALDITYYFVCACMVFLMQLGFAMLEVGCVNEKNINNIILKGTLDICISGICYWAIGFGIAFGGSEAGSFIGGGNYLFGKCLDYAPDCDAGMGYHEWFFQFAFAATAATIVSGAVAERTTTVCYVVYSVILTAFVYPVVVHWQWGSGLTSDAGAVDYAGSGVVHMTGGLAAIVGAAIIGPRKGRFNDDGTVNELPAYSVVFQTLGTLILWFGWYGFNTGSTLGIFWVGELGPGNDDARGSSEAGLVMINTTLAPAAAGLSAMLCTAVMGMQKEGFKLKLGPVLNGILAGLVSITAGCGDVTPFTAVFLGLVGGMIYTGTSALQLKLKIDDVVDAGPVHFWCGIWGVLGIALFNSDTGTGLADHETSFLGANIQLIVYIIIWVGATMGAVFGVLKAAGLARVSAEVEEAGLDVSKHGVTQVGGAEVTPKPAPAAENA